MSAHNVRALVAPHQRKRGCGDLFAVGKIIRLYRYPKTGWLDEPPFSAKSLSAFAIVFYGNSGRRRKL